MAHRFTDGSYGGAPPPEKKGRDLLGGEIPFHLLSGGPWPHAERPSSPTRLRFDRVSDAAGGPCESANPGCAVWLVINAQMWQRWRLGEVHGENPIEKVARITFWGASGCQKLRVDAFAARFDMNLKLNRPS